MAYNSDKWQKRLLVSVRRTHCSQLLGERSQTYPHSITLVMTSSLLSLLSPCPRDPNPTQPNPTQTFFPRSRWLLSFHQAPRTYHVTSYNLSPRPSVTRRPLRDERIAANFSLWWVVGISACLATKGI